MHITQMHNGVNGNGEKNAETLQKTGVFAEKVNTLVAVTCKMFCIEVYSVYLKDEARIENANIELNSLSPFWLYRFYQLSSFSWLLHHLWTSGIPVEYSNLLLISYNLPLLLL